MLDHPCGRPTPRPDRHARGSARLRHGPARFRRIGGAGAHHRRHRPGRAACGGCLHGRVVDLGRQERAHLGAVAVPAAAHRRTSVGGRGRGHRGGLEVPGARARQARVQPHGPGARGLAAGHARRVGVARAVGHGRELRVCDCLRRSGRDLSLRAQRRHRGVHRRLRRAHHRAVALPGRAADDSAAPPRERRLPALQLLHDLRPEDHPRRARGAHRLRAARGRGRGLRAPAPVPSERLPVGARAGLAARAAHRSRIPGGPLPVAAPAVAPAVAPDLNSDQIPLEDSDDAQDRRVRVRARRPDPRQTRPRLLRLLRGQSRHEDLQQGVAGRARARRRSHRDHDGQRLPRRSAGVRHGHPRAHVDHARADSRGRTVAAQPPRRLHGAAAGGVLRRRSVCALRPHDGHGHAHGRAVGRGRRTRGATRQESGRDHRGALHRGRIRHPHPVGGAKFRPRDLAARERLPHPRRLDGDVLQRVHPPHARAVARPGSLRPGALCAAA